VAAAPTPEFVDKNDENAEELLEVFGLWGTAFGFSKNYYKSSSNYGALILAICRTEDTIEALGCV
jgi:hypothetical protein